MSISVKDVEYVAKLAKLELTPEQKEEMVAQLSHIISYINTLNEVDTSDVPPTSHIIRQKGALREDVVKPGLSQKQALLNAPAKSGGYFSVPKVIQKSTAMRTREERK
jgi:aspartyl-tRNA(Asn)/glutamyl-tRNA(Gln) amidotransferase subunit C